MKANAALHPETVEKFVERFYDEFCFENTALWVSFYGENGIKSAHFILYRNDEIDALFDFVRQCIPVCVNSVSYEPIDRSKYKPTSDLRIQLYSRKDLRPLNVSNGDKLENFFSFGDLSVSFTSY